MGGNMNQVIELIKQLGGVLIVEGVVNGRKLQHYQVGNKTVEVCIGLHKPRRRTR
jgi:hypothetical protein